MQKKNLNHLRKNYDKTFLDESEIATASPFDLFETWFNIAVKLPNLEANAMILSTSSNLNKPSSRVVLLKEIYNKRFVFYTNYLSKKSQQLEENSNASLLFFWQVLEQQIRIEGSVIKISTHDSDEYFASRPRESQISAWASMQSSVIPNRKFLEDKFQYFEEVFKNKEIPRPETWGGWALEPSMFEFWQGRINRMHDRIQFTKENETWVINRLCP